MARNIQFDPAQIADRAAVENTAFGGPHTGVAQFVFVDGSVKAVRLTTDLDTLSRLSNRSDGLVINGDY